jgi:LuxR family transcriptional regulator, maltose regulon positive regulatory protein
MSDSSVGQEFPFSILTSKLYIPFPRLKTILRPRLIEKLNEGLLQNRNFERKLTLISAPAGFGKTTLVSEWLANSKQPAAWLSLDEGDNEISCFLTYLVAALQTITKDIGKGVLGAIQSTQTLTAINEALLANLLNEIAAISDPFILVLDDYHMIDSEPIDLALTYLLDHLPPQMHLVVTTRENPSLPLSRYRARGQLTEVRAADLRFTPDEAGVFLNQMMNLNLSAENIAALETRTEGWIAGLQLAALSMQGRDDITSFIQAFTGSHRFVLDYLVEEVLKRETEDIRSFLLRTTILDRFCAPLCNAVTQREDGKEMLDALERSNLFLIPLDDERHWYRYHRLFAEVLTAHLIERQPQEIASLHQRAAVWYEQNGLRPDAIRHALAAKDFELAAGLIEIAWPATDDKSIQPAAWFGWVKTLPDEVVRHRPVLTVWYAYALLGIGEMEATESRFKDAEQLLNGPIEMMVVDDQEQFKSLPAAIAVGRAYIAQAFGNISDTVRYASKVLELPEANHRSQSRASMMLGMTYWANGDLVAANRIFADYTLKLQAEGNIPDAISTTVVLAEIRLALGRLREAISTIEQLLQFVMDQGEPISPDTADLHRGLSVLYLEQGDLEAAAQNLQKSKELGKKADLPVWRYRWCIDQARLNESMGDADEALALLDEAQRLYIRTPLPNFFQISAMKARIYLAQGRLDKALEWVHEQGMSADDDLSFMHEFEHIILARVLIAKYQNERKEDSILMAIQLLDRLLQAAEESYRIGSVIEILVLQALALQALGNITPALATLERAVTLAEPEDFVRIFVDEGKSMAELLKRLDTKSGTPERKQYIRKLLSAYDAPSSFASEGKNYKGHPHTLVEPLSQRELEVLRLLRTDMSGPEIARELMVSLSTMRTHTQNIYAKLGVNDRRAAIRRAEELNLL